MRSLAKEAARCAAALAPGRLPDWVIVGAQKAGTTTLHTALHDSRDSVPPVTKEPHYFTTHWDRPVDWYRAQFRAVPWHRTGEASPYYLFHPLAIARMRVTLPDVRIIVLLRDPVERAHSHWSHNRRRGREPLGFAEAIEAEEARLAGSDPDDPKSAYRHFSYVARGRYAGQLARLAEHYSLRQVLVLKSEDLYAAPLAVVSEVADWVGIRPPRSVPPQNVGGPRAAMPEPLRRTLQERFADDERWVRREFGFGWF